MKSLFTLLLFLTCKTIFSQVLGNFKHQVDNYGNFVVYFEGENITNNTLWNINLVCMNEEKGDKLSLSLNQLNSGGSFYIGPKEGWNWELGEKLFITFSNGKSFYWTYGKSATNHNNNIYQNPNNSYDVTSKKLRIQQIDLQISQLERKIKDSERSLKLFEEMGEKNPSISNSMLQQSTLQLIQTYEQQKYNLELEKIELLY